MPIQRSAEYSPRAGRHVVMFSGGIGSWAAAKRVVSSVGSANVILLFADTGVEDEDTYRFLGDAARNVGGELVRVADGRTPFEVFHDDRFLGNHRLANCSKFLKQRPCRAWLDEHCDPAETFVYVGIDWTEVHRMPGVTKGWAPYEVRAPMCDRPYLAREQVIAWAEAERLHPPDAYGMGFPHANCLAQGCVRGGQAYWRLLLRDRPEVYAKSEAQEQMLREYLDKDVSILDSRIGGTRATLTLRDFRNRVQGEAGLFDTDEWGGCGCFTDDPDPIGEHLDRAA